MNFKKDDLVRFTPKIVAEYKYLQKNNPLRKVLGYKKDDSAMVVLKSIDENPDSVHLEEELEPYLEHDQNDNPKPLDEQFDEAWDGKNQMKPDEIKRWLTEEELKWYDLCSGSRNRGNDG